MLVIRFQRRGTKKIAHHRIVVTERSRSQGGRVLEVIGYFKPMEKVETATTFSLDRPRYDHWVSVGAQVSPSVAKLADRFAKQAKPVSA